MLFLAGLAAGIYAVAMPDFAGDRALRPSTEEPEVIEACRIFYARLLRIAPGVEEILAVALRYPDEPALHLACAFLWLFGQTPEAQKQSAIHLAELEKSGGRLSFREAAWVGGMRLWHAGAFAAAAGAFEEITRQWPQDLPAAKAAEFLYYIIGQQESGPRFLAHMDRLSSWQAGNPDFLAMHAFAHELCGHMGPARHLAEEALGIEPRTPWAQHALEHVLLWEGSSEQAAVLMESWLDSWDQSGRVIHCHNAWHVALMHLDRLAPTRAFAVFETHVWGRTPELVVEQLDAIAFLWRAEMAGVAVDEARYRAIVPHILPLVQTLFMPFLSAHYAYALGRAGETEALEELLHRVDDRAGQDDAEATRVWVPVGRGIIHGSAALGRGEARTAAEWFEPAMPRLTRIGGSDAQDDLFRFAHWDSLRRSGRRSEAKAQLNRRLTFKAASPLEAKLLGEF